MNAVRATTFSSFFRCALSFGRWIRGRQCQCAFRPAVLHGYNEAMDNFIESGAKRTKAWMRLTHFVDGTLSQWRHAQKPTFLEFPPNFSASASA